MNKINVAIIEDEIPAARLLHSMVSGLRPQWELTLIPGSVDEAVAWFDEHPHPDLIFLDIHLADGNAFDFLSAAHPSSVIIFTTAYDQYAIRAFTVNSIDYILKPIDEKRLSDAITKYESLLTNAVPRPEDYLGTLLEALQYKEKRYRTRFLISFRANRQVLVCIDAIDHAEPFFNGKIVVTVRPPYKQKITISEEKLSAFKLWLNH